MKWILLLICLSSLNSCNNNDDHNYVGQLLSPDEKIVATIFELNGKHGLRNKNGDVILPAKYDYIEDWLRWGVTRIDSGGNDASGSDYIHYEMNKIGLVDYKGNILFEPQFDFLVFGDGTPIATVKRNGKFGFINNIGEYESDIIYEDAKLFKNGFAVVKTNKGYGLINTEMKYVIEPKYKSLELDWAKGFSRDTMYLSFNKFEFFKMINKEGEIFEVVNKKK